MSSTDPKSDFLPPGLLQSQTLITSQPPRWKKGQSPGHRPGHRALMSAVCSSKRVSGNSQGAPESRLSVSVDLASPSPQNPSSCKATSKQQDKKHRSSGPKLNGKAEKRRPDHESLDLQVPPAGVAYSRSTSMTVLNHSTSR